ncbi:MAG: hypothetical protein LCH79_07920 [Proteobacteria bacterium]|nr:hypothetical protein [Pseudomonadota bacterium]
MLIRINDHVDVAASEVAYVTLNDRGDDIHVHMKDGASHYVNRDYGKSGYSTKARLVAEINAALKPAAE